MSDGAKPGAGSARTAVIVFTVVIVATALAFVSAQRLKRAPPLVADWQRTPLFSPNGDGKLERARFNFMLRRADTVTLLVTTPHGDPVRTLQRDLEVEAYRRVRGNWNGADDRGRPVPDGPYRIQVAMRDAGRSIQLPFTIIKDTTPPNPKLLSIGPEKTGEGPTRPELLPRADRKPIRVRFRVSGRDPGIAVFRTDLVRPRKVLEEPLEEGQTTWEWDGTVDGRRVAQGTYLVAVHARDKAFNVGWSYGDGEPIAAFGETLEGRGGVVVRYLAAQSPQVAVGAGERAEIGVISAGKQYNWNLRRVGARKAASRGKSRSPVIRPKVPDGPSGMHVFEVRTRDGRTAQSMVLTQDKQESPVLVVVPAASLVGAYGVDDDGDGAPDTLARGVAVQSGRVPVRAELPEDVAENIAPLLMALDRKNRRYDLTTDLALARGTGPTLRGHRGVILAGKTEFIDRTVQRQLVTWVERGGRLWVAEPSSLMRTVDVGPTSIRNPTQAAPLDPFGFELGPLQEVSRVVQSSGRGGLFSGTSGAFDGPLTVEPIVRTPTDGRVLDEATTPDGGQPVLSRVRFERGTVLRTGMQGIGARALRDADARELLRNIWVLLRGDG